MQYMSLISVALGVALLLILNIKFKVHSVLCLLFAAIFVGILEKEPLDKLVLSIQNGLGSTLGSLALVIIFGVAIGQVMVECGAAQRIAGTLLKVFGTKGIKIAIIITGFVFGIAMFFEVAFITLAPLIISIAVEAGLPIISLGMTMIAAATTAHSLFPPQPGAAAIANSLAVPMGEMYIYGLIVAIPTILISGLLLPKFINVKIGVPKALESNRTFTDSEMPSFGISILVPLIPAIIMIATTILNYFLVKNSFSYKLINFFGSSTVSMFVAFLVAYYAFGIKRNKSVAELMKSFEKSISDISVVILIVAAGGVFKQVISDTGVANVLGKMFQENTFMSPFLMAWLITVIIRLATGTGTVSAMIAAGIIAPSMAVTHTNPALMALAIASASNTITHVNDASFWLFKEYFGLTIKDTFKTWGLSELVNSIVGLVIVLILSIFIH